jgi:hypothetical protein
LDSFISLPTRAKSPLKKPRAWKIENETHLSDEEILEKLLSLTLDQAKG